MKKIIVFIIILTFMTFAFADLEVDEDELAKGSAVDFVNYYGPYTEYLTVDQIRDIGIQMGKNVGKEPAIFRYYAYYTVIHAIDPADTSERLDADILVMEKETFLDHIRNLRLIISGYLEAAYGYTRANAVLLAKFVTYYNAVFRGDVDYFGQRYKGVVTKHLSKDDAGLATKYYEWPGRTKILIPLRGDFERGKISSLETDELTEDEVIEKLREEEDKGLEDRKDMVELQEKELEEEEKELDKDREEVKEMEEKLLDGETEDEEKLREDIEEKKDDIEEKQTELDERESDLQEDREQIADDQRALDEETEESETTTKAVDKAIFLKVQEGEDPDGEIMMIDFIDQKVLNRTTGVTVKGRRMELFSNMLLVLAKSTAGTYNFVLVDPVSLDVSVQGEDEIFTDTIYLSQSNIILAVVKKDGTWRLGKLDKTLKLQATSEEEVNPYTPIIISGTNVYVQAKDGKVLRLGFSDLKLLKSVSAQ